MENKLVYLIELFDACHVEILSMRLASLVCNDLNKMIAKQLYVLEAQGLGM